MTHRSKNKHRTTTRPPLRQVYRTLFNAGGPQHWWPGRTRFEVIVGAILTQNTAWHNVEKAITRLRQARALTPLRLHQAELQAVADWIRPAGYYNISDTTGFRPKPITTKSPASSPANFHPTPPCTTNTTPSL